jgi:hypothetical protein
MAVAETPLSPEQVAVLICPALTESRYRAERFTPPRWLFRRRREWDFVRQQWYCKDWGDYRNRVVAPLLDDLMWLRRNSEVQLEADVSFDDFQEIVANSSIRAVFLIAHHFQLHNGTEAVEFADGGVPVEIITRALRALPARPVPLGLAWFVCAAGDLKKNTFAQSPALGATAWATWNMPLTDSLAFIRCWLAELDGRRSFAEAYHYALPKFLYHGRQ